MEGRFNQQRRQVVAAGIAGAGLASIGTPALAQARTKIRVGYVDTLAVTGQMWTGVHRGHWAKENIEFDPIKFNTGLELFNAMIGGSLDMLSTGAVISNFPARGQGKAFLINNIEFATAQLWIREDQGVKTWADLKGKRITTTLGTTAHVFLDAALRANGIDPTKDVGIVNQTMPVAVTSFISGAVPAVALWVPFNIQVRQRVPAARMLVDASAYFPKSAIVGGWAVRTDYYEKNKPVLARVVRGWAASNDDLMKNPDAILPTIQAKNYAQVPIAELQEQFKASRYYSAAEWRKLYQDGTAVGWLQQVTDFYTRFGGIKDPVPARTYFDTALFLDNVKA